MHLRIIRVLLFVSLAAALFVSDFLLKNTLVGYFSVAKAQNLPIFSTGMGIDFSLTYVENTGGAWGMLSSRQIPLLIVRVLIILSLMGYWILRVKTFQKRFWLFFIIMGASCNVFDTLYYGYVIDLFHFTFWGRSFGVFNLADAMIFIGAIGVLCFSTINQKDELVSNDSA